jgi:mannose-6-phosphate isomerase
MPFDVLLREHKEAYLGQREDLGVLVKFLDSAIRLPMQAHPTRAFSRANFHSPYGKAESWVILDTRENACIYFGFKDKIEKTDFETLVRKSEDDKECMTSVVNRIPVKAGDVFFVDAGVIHAIGAGCLILEVQEPTDFTIQTEYWCGEYHLNAQEMYLGLEKHVALGCFKYDYYGDAVLKNGKKIPKVLKDEGGVRHESLIGPEDTLCFAMDRYTLRGGETVLETPASIWICVEGEGTVCGEGYSRDIKMGDYFFLPAGATGAYRAVSRKGMKLVCCVGGK